MALGADTDGRHYPILPGASCSAHNRRGQWVRLARWGSSGLAHIDMGKHGMTNGAMFVRRVGSAFMAITLAFGGGVSADEPVPALIAFDGEAGGGGGSGPCPSAP